MVLLLLALAAAVLVVTYSKLQYPSWKLAGLVVLSGVAFGGFGLIMGTIALLRATSSAPPQKEPEEKPPETREGGDKAKKENTAPPSPEVVAPEPPADTELRDLVKEVRELSGHLKELEEELESDPSVDQVKNSIETLRIDVNGKIEKAQESIKNIADNNQAWPEQLSALQTQMTTLSNQVNAWQDLATSLKNWEVVQHIDVQSEIPSPLTARVKPRYLMLLKNRPYREQLADWAASSELRLALKHLRDLYLESVRQLAKANTLMPRHRDHWEKLNRTASERLHSMLPLLNRLVQLRDVSDESDSAAARHLLGLRPQEEKNAWVIIPKPPDGVAHKLDQVVIGSYARESAEALLERVVTPLVLLYQELFEARLIEQAAPPEERFEYESASFKDDQHPRGEVEAAIRGAASVLGFTYRPIRLYSSVQSESGQLLKVVSAPKRVTWQEWLGRDDPRSGIIVRLERPAFIDNQNDKLLNEGALAVIGGPGNAGRE